MILFSPPEEIALHPFGHTPVVCGCVWAIVARPIPTSCDNGLARVTALSAACLDSVAKLGPWLTASALGAREPVLAVVIVVEGTIVAAGVGAEAPDE